MKQNFTLDELQAALRIARLMPASTSPLAGLNAGAQVSAAVAQTLRSKGVLNGTALAPEWQRALATLADPQQQASAYVERVGGGRYFGGIGGVATIVPLPGGEQSVIGGMTREGVLGELNALLDWRSVPDGPPLRTEISAEELTAIAAIADACREEQLRAVIERRQPVVGRVSFSDLEGQVAMSTQKRDPHWLLSILADWAPPSCSFDMATLKQGNAALLNRGWVIAREGTLQLGAQLEVMCAAFGTVTPFLALAVGAPWLDPEIAIFTRGVPGYWSIEFRNEETPSRRVSIARLGARAMDEVLGRRFGALWSSSVAEPARAAAVAPPPPQTRIQPTAPPVTQPAPTPRPPAPSQASKPVATNGNACASCGKPLKPGSKFCTSCGKPVAGAAAASKPAVCPNPKCGKPITPGTKFCTACGTRLAQAAQVQ